VAGCDEAELFGATPFACGFGPHDGGGTIELAVETVPLAALSGAVVRLRRDWWPSTDFSLQDQHFVYHETLAAWFSLFAGLTCPVLNRLPLDWWVGDTNYAERLRHDCAARLGIAARLAPPSASPEPPLSVFVAGDRIIPGSDAAQAAASFLDARAATVRAWQRERGLHYSRFDFAAASPWCLEHVEAQPALADEPGAITERIGAALMEVLA
jgi:hypothetical protein